MNYRKYGNKEIIVNGIRFQSKKEANRYCELLLLQRAKIISNLKLQPRFLLQEGFKKNGKTYKKIEYIADFQYVENGKVIIEDVKGYETEVFKIKHKLFEYKYPEFELRLVK